MRYVTLSFCALLLIGSVALPQTAAEKEAKVLQGVWRGVYGETSRERISPEEAKKIRLIFKDDLVTIQDGKEVLKATYRLIDVLKKPRSIDLTSTEGKTKGRIYKGIYDIDNDTLKICFSESDQERPTELAAEGKPGIRTLLILQREKK
jgi:uncharacterized protein (TIGR03067 family)